MAASLMTMFSRLLVRSAKTDLTLSSQFHTQTSPLLFQVSERLCAEPMKKRKKMDPAATAARTQKKLKRLDKEIKRLSRFGKILKPVEEIEVDRRKLIGSGERRRDSPVLTFEESEERATLVKEWSVFRRSQYTQMLSTIARVKAAQEEALDELREESEELYLAAIKKDEMLLPLKIEGPKETPPIKGFVAPDGEYVDTTRKF